tara:strand:+ start:2540 stop:3325 length:786 start_codon:yes stop_codon:yes gene_type:complete
MGSLAGKSPSSTYKSLLKVADETNGVSTSTSQIEDGEGTATCLSVSDDNLSIQPQNDNSVATLQVRNASGTTIFRADTSNSVCKVGSTLTPANSQILEFHAKTLVPTGAGTHMFVSRAMASYSLSAIETSCGTGTDPDTTLDAGAATDDLLQNLFIVPVNSTIDACKFMVSTVSDTDCTLNVHLYKFTMTNAGSTDDGNLTGGTLLASGQATAVDRNVIKTVDCTINSSAVSAGEVIACFVENETNTDSIFIQTQVLYHFN